MDGSYLDDNSISGDKLTDNYKSAVTLEIGQAATGALNSAKSYADGKDATNLQAAKDYADGKDATALQSAKDYADGKDATTLQTAKDYADGKAGTAENNAKGYTDTQLTGYTPTSTLTTLLANLLTQAKKLYITGQDGTEYAGELKVVNGKPVFEYDTTEGGN